MSQYQQLPAAPSLEQLKKQAKDLRKAVAGGDAAALARVRAVPELAQFAAKEKLSATQAQLIVARGYGFESWPKLKRHVESIGAANSAAALIEACLGGDTNRANELLAANPALSATDLYTACVTGDATAAERLLVRDPGIAKAKGGPKDREPLLYLCFSRFWRAEPARTEAALAIAQRLLKLGADANAFFTRSDYPNDPQKPLYGAAGINNQPGLTRLLLDAGADPNDTESLYHASEWEDNASLKLLFAARLKPDWVSYCLARKLDFEHYDGVKLYLDHGADPNFVTPFGERWTRLHHTIERGRGAKILELLLERGGDISIRDARGHTPYALAVRLGRVELAAVLRRHGASDAELTQADKFLGACAAGDIDAARAVAASNPRMFEELTAHDHEVFTDAAQHGRMDAIRTMLAAGFKPEWLNPSGATELHAACFSGRLEVVKLLLEHRPPLEIRDNEFKGTPLDWAIAGTVKVPWGNPNGDYVSVVEALLAAGARPPDTPRGRADVQAVLEKYAAKVR
jgi:hypothetical protein